MSCRNTTTCVWEQGLLCSSIKGEEPMSVVVVFHVFTLMQMMLCGHLCWLCYFAGLRQNYPNDFHNILWRGEGPGFLGTQSSFFVRLYLCLLVCLFVSKKNMFWGLIFGSDQGHVFLNLTIIALKILCNKTKQTNTLQIRTRQTANPVLWRYQSHLVSGVRKREELSLVTCIMFWDPPSPASDWLNLIFLP